MKEIRKALTFRASSIGDCLMGAYLLDNVHAQFPQAKLGIVVASRGGMIGDLLVAYPYIEVIEANRKSPRALWRLWRQWRGSDLVVTQYAGKPGGRFSFASKIAARLLARRGGLVGFADASRFNALLYDRLLPIGKGCAVAEQDREALRAAGISVSLPFPVLKYAGSEALSKFSLEPRAFVLVHLFAGNNSRGLSPGKKRELLLSLARELPGVRLVLSGAAADAQDALDAAEGIPAATVIAGDTTLQELMQIIAHSRAVVSVDTGAAHMAAQLGVPLAVMRTCLGAPWWMPGQYAPDAPISVFEHDQACAEGHIRGDFPPCINGIDMRNVAARAAVI